MRSLGAALADLGCVLLFVVIGRANHHAGGGLAGLWDTAWPFATGTAVGLIATRYWQRPQAIAPVGVFVWLCTVGIGMLLRVVSGQGTAFAFILVALAFLGLFQLGWRVAAALVLRSRPRSRSRPRPQARAPH
jgi:Protein of unknown function (DUF3054)